MNEIRWHGRGGQGAVTAAELLARAAIDHGLYAHAFPFFGPERRGAPVRAFTRIDTNPIEVNCQIYEPDVVVVLDATLLRTVPVTEGLKRDGVLVVNATQGAHTLKNQFEAYRVAVVDATGIALKWLGLNVVSTAMLGAVAKATGVIGLPSIEKTVAERFDPPNLEAVRETYARTEVA